MRAPPEDSVPGSSNCPHDFCRPHDSRDANACLVRTQTAGLLARTPRVLTAAAYVLAPSFCGPPWLASGGRLTSRWVCPKYFRAGVCSQNFSGEAYTRHALRHPGKFDGPSFQMYSPVVGQKMHVVNLRARPNTVPCDCQTPKSTNGVPSERIPKGSDDNWTTVGSLLGWLLTVFHSLFSLDQQRHELSHVRRLDFGVVHGPTPKRASLLPFRVQRPGHFDRCLQAPLPVHVSLWHPVLCRFATPDLHLP